MENIILKNGLSAVITQAASTSLFFTLNHNGNHILEKIPKYIMATLHNEEILFINPPLIFFFIILSKTIKKIILRTQNIYH
jgi:hypothetical protein